MVARIGSEDRLVSGERTYVITYTCNLGHNGEDAFDEFYRNVIMCSYGNTIENASFTIEMPKDFDASNVYCYLGEYESGSPDGVEWSKRGNTITGRTTRPIKGGEFLTVQIWLPEGYFVGVVDPEAVWRVVSYVVSGACVLLALILWLTLGRDSEVYPTVEFYPPEGMTPAEAGYIIDGCVDNKDVVSLILYWADKGIWISWGEKISSALSKARAGRHEGLRRRCLTSCSARRHRYFGLAEILLYTTMEATRAAVANYLRGQATARVYKASKTARGWMCCYHTPIVERVSCPNMEQGWSGAILAGVPQR